MRAEAQSHRVCFFHTRRRGLLLAAAYWGLPGAQSCLVLTASSLILHTGPVGEGGAGEEPWCPGCHTQPCPRGGLQTALPQAQLRPSLPPAPNSRPGQGLLREVTTLRKGGHSGPAAMATATGQRQAVSTQHQTELRQAHAADQSHGCHQPSMMGLG